MKWRCFSVLVAVVFACALSPSCRSGPQPDAPKKILLVLKTSDNPFFRSIEAGARRAIEERGLPADALIVRAGGSEGAVSDQRRILDQFHSQYLSGTETPGLQALLLTPSGSADELTANVKSYRESGVPVVLVDTAINADALARAGTSYDAFVGSDNRQGGGLAAELIAERCPEGGRVLLVNGVQGQETADARRDGFRAGIADLAARGIKFDIIERTANWRRTEARSLVDSMFAMGQGFVAVFAANDEMALGAAEAIRQSRQASRHIVVVGFDAIDEARSAVQSGEISATIAQQPEEMGRRAVLAALDVPGLSSSKRDLVIPVTAVVR